MYIYCVTKTKLKFWIHLTNCRVCPDGQTFDEAMSQCVGKTIHELIYDVY